ncbi:microtubule-associated protein tau-like isoform X3 [Sphaeramia orbicularis]|uniref:microtubule-associated protein tau-like isoform X3 n=1 Tax=Sphaeramia orbicularis TaxID=375764 RepID=UPI00117D0FB8|nr:microtubule-associated protein tau-like isoform X3 [Sphaeramia orbicularis]
MDLSLRDALGGGGGGGVPGGAPAEALLKRDFVATLEKESYDDKVGETVSKSDYRPLLDGKDAKSGAGMMSSMMSSGGRQEPPGQPAFGSDYLSGPVMGGMTGQWNQNKMKDTSVPDSFLGFSQSGMGGTGLPPFQTSMSSTLGQSGIGLAMDTQKSSGLFGSDPKPAGNISGGSPFKASDPFSTGGPGIHGLDHSTAPILSPSGSMDDSSPTSSTSEPLSPERAGPGGEVGKQQQRRRKKKRKGRDEVYDFLDRQENNVGQSDKSGLQDKGEQEEEEDEDEEENWEWEIRESGGGGRVRGRKTKSRARLPEEWGAPQQLVSTAADSGLPESKALKSSPSPVPPTSPSQIPTSFTNHSHASLATDSSPRSYEPMCVDDFPVSTKNGQKQQEEKVPPIKPETTISSAAASRGADVSASLALMTGDNLSPVSQTFSFLDSVLQTPPGSAPDSQTTTPVTNTPSLATAPVAKPTLAEASVPQPTLFTPASTSPSPFTAKHDTPSPSTTVGSGLNIDAKPFVPAAALMPTTATTAAASPSSIPTPAVSAALCTGPTATASPSPLTSSAPAPTSIASSFSPATATAPPSVTPAAPPSHPAHSEHQESSSPLLPPLEAVKSDNKDKQEKTDIMSKMDTSDKKVEQQKKDTAPDKNQQSEKILKDEEKTEKLNAEKNNEKAEKVDKPEKTNKDEKKEEEKKAVEKKEEKGGKDPAKSPTGNGGKTLQDNKSKPDAGSAKPNSRPSTLSTNGEANSAKRPSPTTASANKKSPVPKATTPTTTKRPPTATGTAKAAKTPENEKRPPVPKATPTPRANTTKNANKNDKTENKTGEAKKPKSTARPRPASTAAPTPPATTNGEAGSTHRRRVITKPPVPKQTPMEKKPAVPRAPRTPRPINAPTPDLKNVRSKIGSIDNIKYQPGGGKVSSTPNNKTSDPSTPTAKARVQIVHKKLDFSHVTSRCGSKDNIKYVPGGGNVQILNKKVDVSKVTSKCGSKDNIKHKPGGGDVKIESHKVNVKAKSKIGSMDNMAPGNGQTNGHKEEKAEEKMPSPPSGTTGPAVAKATAPGSVAKENG